MKKVLISGIAGFIGRALYNKFKYLDDIELYGIDLGDQRTTFSDCKTFFWTDLSRTSSISHLLANKSFDEIYQCAGWYHNRKNKSTPEGIYDIIFKSSILDFNLLQILNRKNQSSKIYYPSSNNIYSTEINHPTAYKESDYIVNDFEGIQKSYIEQMYLSFHRVGVHKVRIGRLPIVYGPGKNIESKDLDIITDLCKKMYVAKKNNLELLDVWGSAEHKRSLLYITDCVDLMQEHMNSNIVGPINVPGTVATLDEITSILSDVAGYHPGIRYYTGPGGPLNIETDCSIFNEHIKINNKYSLVEGIYETWIYVSKRMKSYHRRFNEYPI